MYSIYNGAENNCIKIFVLVYSMGVYYGKEKKIWNLLDWTLYTHILSHSTPWLANLQKRATTMYLLYNTGFIYIELTFFPYTVLTISYYTLLEEISSAYYIKIKEFGFWPKS